MLIRKRNKEIEPFNIAKVKSAMQKALDAANCIYTDSKLEECAKDAVVILERQYIDEDGIVDIEEVQDVAEEMLAEYGYFSAARAFIKYRETRKKQRELNKVRNDFAVSLVEGSLGSTNNDLTERTDPCAELDVIKNQNASTAGGTIGASILQSSEAVSKIFWESVYDPEINEMSQIGDKNEIYIHDMGMVAPYCCGWSLADLIRNGLTGVDNKISSAPAKHLVVLCAQLTNFLGIMQNEAAGAQAVSSFDTYLAPFIKADNLSYKEVKQAIQIFVFGVNVPSRWGCVDAETELLTENGFKKYNEVKEGDNIYTWNDGKLELNSINKVVIKEFDGKMHSYQGRGYHQFVTPEHRVLCKKHNEDKYIIKHSEEIFDVKTAYALPAKFKVGSTDKSLLTSDEVQLASIVYCDGSVDLRKGKVHKITIYKSPNREGNELIEELSESLGLKYSLKEKTGGFDTPVNVYTYYGDSARYIYNLIGSKTKIDEKFIKMNAEKSMLFLQTWSMFDGEDEKFMLQYDNDDIKDALQHIALRAGFTSYVENTKKANYVKIRQVENIYTTKREEIEYKGIVWCPSVDNGTAVFRKDGCVFISGQSQAPFSNITLDWTVPEDLKEQTAIVGGKDLYIDGKAITYGDCQKEADMINKAFLEVMLEGDADGRGFQYPIPTYNITPDFNWEETENNKLLFEMAAKYGTPYFSNYVNSDMKPSDVRSMCCRLRLDLRELRKQNGGNFGAGENTGSIGVVTIDLPQLAYLAFDEEDFFKRLEHAMNVAARSLDIKRRVINSYLAKGAYPYIRAYLKAGFKNHFSTIGLVGMNEACLNASWLKKDLTNQECLDWAAKVLDFMRNKLSDYQEQYGNLFNLEATPAESTCYTLARKDKKKFPGIITAGKPGETPYYTNSTHLPVEKVDDIFDALDKEDNLQTKYTSGTVFHAFLGEKLPDWRAAAKLVRTIAENYKLPYFTLSPTYSICSEHGYINGEVKACPHCGKKTEIYSRITGYYRPVSNWNDGKAQEFIDRNTYDMKKAFSKIENSIPKKEETQEKVKVEEKTLPVPEDDTLIILSTQECPKCKMAKMAMDQKGMHYVNLFDTDEKGRKLALAFNIASAPVLFVPKDGKYEVINDFNQILAFIKK